MWGLRRSGVGTVNIVLCCHTRTTRNKARSLKQKQPRGLLNRPNSEIEGRGEIKS